MRIVWICLLSLPILASFIAGTSKVQSPTAVHIIALDSLDTDIALRLKVLDSVYSSAPMLFIDSNHYYFYVVNGFWYGYQADSKDPEFFMGIVNENFDTILPPIYNKIYSPNITAKGYIEIELDGKRGLLNYHTKKVIPATFDVIFPSHTAGVVAIGRRGNQYYNLLPSGNEQLITNKTKEPTYLTIAKDLAFDINKVPTMLLDTQFWDEENREVPEYNHCFGIVVPPSYLIATGFVEPWIWGIDIRETSTAFKLIESKNTIEQTKTIQWGLGLLVSDFYTEGIDVRGTFNVRSKLFATVDSNNNVVGKAKYYVSSDYNNPYQYLAPKTPYRLIGDTLIEAVRMEMLFVEYPIPDGYDAMINYSHYEIKQTGEINRLTNNRQFPFTKYVYLTEANFRGSYVIDRNAYNDTLKWPDDLYITAYITDHLNAYDLELMYNEILAEYGYKFKDEKWDTHFRQYDWYNPQFDNVDNQLNKYEKANLKLIKAIRSKVAKNPEKYIHGQFVKGKNKFLKWD